METRPDKITPKPASIGSAFERHYRVKELAELWRFSHYTIIDLFKNEEGVIKLSRGSGQRTTHSVPESVVRRVHARLTDQPFGKWPLKGRPKKPLGIIRLRDLGLTRQPGYIFKLKTGERIPIPPKTSRRDAKRTPGEEA